MVEVLRRESQPSQGISQPRSPVIKVCGPRRHRATASESVSAPKLPCCSLTHGFTYEDSPPAYCVQHPQTQKQKERKYQARETYFDGGIILQGRRSRVSRLFRLTRLVAALQRRVTVAESSTFRQVQGAFVPLFGFASRPRNILRARASLDQDLSRQIWVDSAVVERSKMLSERVRERVAETGMVRLGADGIESQEGKASSSKVDDPESTGSRHWRALLAVSRMARNSKQRLSSPSLAVPRRR